MKAREGGEVGLLEGFLCFSQSNGREIVSAQNWLHFVPCGMCSAVGLRPISLFWQTERRRYIPSQLQAPGWVVGSCPPNAAP